MNLKFNKLAIICFVATLSVGCGSDSTVDGPAPTPASTPPPISSRPKIVAYGDSLTSGFGLDSWEKSYPTLLQKRLDAEGYDFQVLNYGQAGDTTERGLSRLYLATGVAGGRIYILELGANDAMKGVPIAEIRSNLEEIIKRLEEEGIEVLLCEWKAPESVDGEYREALSVMYRDLAAQHGLTLMPDFLAGVASNRDLMMEDGIHPNEAGVRVIEENVYRALLPMLSKYEKRKQ